MEVRELQGRRAIPGGKERPEDKVAKEQTDPRELQAVREARADKGR